MSVSNWNKTELHHQHTETPLKMRFDTQLCTMSLSSHIKQVSEVAFFCLHDIIKIRGFFYQNDAQKLICAFIASRLNCF